MLYPAQAEGYGKIVMLAGVMRYVCGPPETLFMGYTVRPITAQIIQHITGQQGPPVQRHAPGNKVINDNNKIQEYNFDRSTYYKVAYAYQHRAYGFFLLVILPVLEVRNYNFQCREQGHKGHGPENKVRRLLFYIMNQVHRNFIGSKEG